MNNFSLSTALTAVVLVLPGDGVDFKAIEDELKKQCDGLLGGEFASKALSHSFTVFARDMVEVSPNFIFVLIFTFFFI